MEMQQSETALETCLGQARLPFEGVFRQATVSKGRNRDMAWFSILDVEWPAARAAFEQWLDPANFDKEGQQRAGLADIRGRLPQAG